MRGTWSWAHLEVLAAIGTEPALRVVADLVRERGGSNHIRERGDGYRSLYICEDCRVTSCTAAGWN